MLTTSGAVSLSPKGVCTVVGCTKPALPREFSFGCDEKFRSSVADVDQAHQQLQDQ